MLALAPFAWGGCSVERATAVELGGSTVAEGGGSGVDASTDGPDGGPDSSPDVAVVADAVAVSPACTQPAFVTSSPSGIWSNGGYYVFNNVWNTGAGPGPQILYACSYHSFYVVSDQADDAGAVESYPNVQMNFSDVPITSLHGITSRFVESGPGVGIYEFAYDVWLNGVAQSGSVQVLVWVDNFNRVPDGTKAASTTLGGRAYDVWVTPDGLHVVFDSTTAWTSGTVDLLGILQWTVGQGWLPASSTLGQIDFGVEIVSTGGASATYAVDDFSLATN